ncbi:MAG: restriction endonuclease, partial [Ignavibacteria bacterium]|nr:restriction endonuclease [Ignavibacteria bacterium]
MNKIGEALRRIIFYSIAIPMMFYIGNNLIGFGTGKAINTINEGTQRKKGIDVKTEEIKQKEITADKQYYQKQEANNNQSNKPIILIIVLIGLASLTRFIWKINKEYQSGTEDREKQERRNKVESYYKKRIYKNDNSAKGEITRFKRPGSWEASSDQEEVKPEREEKKETVWSIAFLMSLEWKVFEDVCAEYLRLKNCNGNVTHIGKDGGIDLKVTDKAGNVIALGQCKAWSKPVGVSLVRELYGIMAAKNVRHGVYITTSTFTEDAQAFGNNKRLLLINGADFITNINALDEENRTRLANVATVEGYTIPTCARCDAKMVKRTAQKGKYAGSQFWGCSNYPRCKSMIWMR